MKKTLLIILAIVLSQSVFSQNIDLKTIEAKFLDELVVKNGYPGSQHPMMIEKEKKIIEYLEQNPNAKQFSLTKSMAWGFNVGDTHSWWADYFEDQDSGDTQYEVPSTCQGVGTHCYVFVENAVWNVNIDQTAVDAIIAEFDNTIYPTDVATFGAPPDVDSDPRIIILVLDIQDGNDPSSYVAGYYYSANQYPDGQVPWDNSIRSNEAEIFYMDCNPADPINDPIGFFSTLAHEFQHNIHFAHGYPEMTFINEACSMIAEYICGYGIRSNGLYAGNTNVYLLGWDLTGNVLDDYSRAAFWMLYLYEQLGAGILKDFVNNQHSTWVDIDSTIRPHFASGFVTLVTNWWIANYTNSSSGVSEYNYSYSPIAQSASVATHIGNIGNGSGSLEPLATDYITFTNGDDLSITFTGGNIVKVKALKIGSLEIEDVPLNTPYSPSGYGTTYPEVTFMVYNESAGANQNYTYNATGSDVSVTLELAYEDGVSDGRFGWNEGDSIAVIFPGTGGATLDSVKVFFDAGTGKIDMDISKHDGTNFLRGQNMFSSTRTILTSQVWNKIDLTAQNLDASNDFVVSFLVGSNSGTSSPDVAVRSMPDNGEYHSRTYTNNNGTTQWWIFYTSGPPEGYWNYLIRAYISIGNATVAIDPSGIVTIPNDFSLGANYPNPFNPSTTFDFATPNDGLVEFTVYDLLGQIIFTESRNLFAGKYQFTWDGQNQLDQQVVSGVYFLKMEAEGFTQTRKMLMMK